MIETIFSKTFTKKVKSLKHKSKKKQILKLIKKIKENPDTGKPMRYTKKDSRESYMKPFRISYTFKNNTILFVELYHKDQQ